MATLIPLATSSSDLGGVLLANSVTHMLFQLFGVLRTNRAPTSAPNLYKFLISIPKVDDEISRKLRLFFQHGRCLINELYPSISLLGPFFLLHLIPGSVSFCGVRSISIRPYGNHSCLVSRRLRPSSPHKSPKNLRCRQGSRRRVSLSGWETYARNCRLGLNLTYILIY